MRSRTLVIVIGSIVSSTALAQFGAHGGPSREVDLFVKLPWLVVMATLALAWFGPRRQRPALRRVSKHAFVAYISITSMLFVGMVALSATFGPNTEPLMTVGGLFLVSLVFSGALIVGLMATSLSLIGAKAVLGRFRASTSNTTSDEETTPNPSTER